MGDITITLSEMSETTHGFDPRRGEPTTTHAFSDNDPLESEALLSEIVGWAENNNIEVSKKADSHVDDREKHFGGALTTIVFAKVLMSVGAAGAGIAFLNATRDLAVQWMKNRGGRSISITDSTGKSVSISGDDDFEKALKILNELQ